MEKSSNHEYMLDVQYDPFICHNRKNMADHSVRRCVSARGGYAIWPTMLNVQSISSEKSISLLIAIGDEDEVFHSATPVQLVGMNRIPAHYTAIAYIGLNIKS